MEAARATSADLGSPALRRLAAAWRTLFAGVVLGGALGYAASWAFTPTYVSTTLFIPPQQQQGGAAAALASLSALSGLLGGGARTPTDQYITMLKSVTVSDRVIQRFGLAKVYGTEFKEQTRKRLARRVVIETDKKDGLIRLEVEDADPKRAAAMANDYVEELRILTSHLAVTEAQQRRMFFEHLLDETRRSMVAAQVALEGSGFSPGAIKAEPMSAAEGYAKLKAQLTAAQVKLEVARNALAETSPQVRQLAAEVDALSGQLQRLQSNARGGEQDADYLSRYRDFKYQETLFELYAKQYELARLDEAREGAIIQVVDPAEPAELKHFPLRAVFAVLGAALGLAAAALRAWPRARAGDGSAA